MSRPRLLGWLLVLATLLAYLPILRNGFVNLDDQDYVTENPTVLKGITWDGIQWAFTTLHASNWHPLTWLSHMLDCELFRLNPAGHHLVSLLLHVLNTWLLFLLWLRLTGAAWASAMVAALFAWHPLHVESVAWVSERKDVLSTCFALLALLSYVAWAKSDSLNPPPAASRPTRHYWLAVLFFALGLMSKPMLVTLPFVMLLLDFWPLQRTMAASHAGPPWRSRIVEKWPFFLLTAASCAITVLAQRAEAIAPLAKYSLTLRGENVIAAYGEYIFKALWPEHLAVFYPLLQPSPASVALSAAVLLVISLLVVWRIKSQPYLAVAWLWFLGTLVPVIGLLQVGDQALADRYTYFPLVGIFMAATWGANDLARRWRLPSPLLAAIAILFLVGCLGTTEAQLRHWRNSETLFLHALAVTPDNASARLNLGEAYQVEKRPDDALTEYRRALQLDPSRHEAYNNIGRLLNDQGKAAEALPYCRQAVVLNPRSAPSHNGLGVVLAELGQNDEALREFAEAGRLDPRSGTPHFQTGRILLKLGQDAKALSQFHEALRLEPANFAILIFSARVFASDQNLQGRDGKEALAIARRAAQLGGAQPVVLDTLAMACAEAGQFEEAAHLARQAVEAARAAGAIDDAANMQQRLDLYEKQQPARTSFQTP